MNNDYYAIRIVTGSGVAAFYVHPQGATAPSIVMPHHRQFTATLFCRHEDAQASIDELPHREAKKCEIVQVDVRGIPEVP